MSNDSSRSSSVVDFGTNQNQIFSQELILITLLIIFVMNTAVYLKHTWSICSFSFRPSNLLLVDFGQIFSKLVIEDQLFELLPQLMLRLKQTLYVLLLLVQLHNGFTDLHKIKSSLLNSVSSKMQLHSEDDLEESKNNKYMPRKKL